MLTWWMDDASSGCFRIDRNNSRICCMGTVSQFQEMVRYMKGTVEALRSLETNVIERRSLGVR